MEEEWDEDKIYSVNPQPTTEKLNEHSVHTRREQMYYFSDAGEEEEEEKDEDEGENTFRDSFISLDENDRDVKSSNNNSKIEKTKLNEKIRNIWEFTPVTHLLTHYNCTLYIHDNFLKIN